MTMTFWLTICQMKICPVCESQFEPKSPRHKKQQFCSTPCCRKQYQQDHPEIGLASGRKARKNNPDKTYWYHIKYQYGLTKEQYQEMMVQQNNACAICKQSETHIVNGKLRTLSVDHNHDTGQVRKLLCHSCNAALGLLKEDPQIMFEMIKYILED